MYNKHQQLQNWFPIKESRHNANPDKIPAISEGEIW
jgi:hypothetical protein